MPEHTTYLGKAAITALINSAASALATVILLPLVIRNIGIEAYGLWAMLGLFIGIASLLDLGVWKAVVYLVPRQAFTKHQVTSTALALCALAGVLFSAGLLAAVALGAPVLGKAVLAHGNLTWWVATGGCLIVLLSLLTNVLRGVLEAEYAVHVVNLGYALLTLILYGVASAISFKTSDPRALIVGSVAVYIAVLLGHVAYAVGAKRLRLVRPERDAASAILGYGTRLFAAEAPTAMLTPTVLYIFLQVAPSSGEYGIFDIALRIAMLAMTTLSMLAAPFHAIAAATGPDAQMKLKATVARYLRATIAIGLAGCMAFWVFGEYLLKLFFRDSPLQIFRADMIMLWGCAAIAALEPLNRMLMGLGKLKTISIVRYTMLAGTLGAVVILGGMAPLDRFALSVGFGYGLSAVVLAILYRRGNSRQSGIQIPIAQLSD